MVEIIKKSLLLSLCASACIYAQPVLVDQSIAVVDKKVLTLRDVQARVVADHILDHGSKDASSLEKDLANLDVIQDVRQTLVDETLIDSYFQSGQLKQIEVNSSPVEIPKNLKIDMKAFNISQDLVLKMVYLKKQKDAFIESFIILRVNRKPGELETYYNEWKDKKYEGKPLALVRKTVEADQRRSKLQEEYSKWRESQIVRSNIIFLPLPTKL